MKPPDIDALLAKIDKEAEKQRKDNQIAFRLFMAQGVLGIFTLIMCMWQPRSFWFFMPLVMGLALAKFAFMFRNKEAQQKAIVELSKAEDIRIVGPLCDHLWVFDQIHVQGVIEALIRLLPRLKASDASALTASQKAGLYAQLNGDNAPLILAILHSLEQIGDGAALPYVEKLAERKLLAAKDGRVWLAAKDCLPFLRERAAQESQAQTLLRPAEETSSPDVLLRPAAQTSESVPEQLLRSAAAHREIL